VSSILQGSQDFSEGQLSGKIEEKKIWNKGKSKEQKSRAKDQGKK
jgi:hypothetical protein